MDERERNIWWGPPRSFAEKIRDRKISWLELFYDLVYVAAISQLTQYLTDHPTWDGLGNFFFMFSLIFWSWLNGMYYHDTHGSTGIRTRYFTLLQMFVIADITVTLPDLFNGDHRNFAIAFTCVQALINYLWWSVGYYDKSHRRLNLYYFIVYSIGVILFFISIYTDFQTAKYLWMAALLGNYSVPFLASRITVNELKSRGIIYVTTTSVIERLGLFTIIVLGENILGTVHGISSVQNQTLSVWAIFLIAILIAFLLWWVYFDMTGDSEAKPGYRYFLFLNLVNIPLLASFAAAGSSIRVILHETELSHFSIARYIFGINVTVILLGIYILTKLMKQDEEEETVMNKLANMVLATSAATFALTIFCMRMEILTWLGSIALVLAIPVYLGTRIWVKFKIFSE